MSYPVNVSFQVQGGVSLNDYLHLTLHQQALTHHSFALDLSVEALAVWSRNKVSWVAVKDTRIFSPFGANEFVAGEALKLFKPFGKNI
ncbi:MAG: hypothetical protein ACRYGH_14975, partial [Janthinobacterium lividum]